MSEAITIDVLLAALGFLSGVGVTHFFILKKVNQIALAANTLQGQVNTLFRDDATIRQMIEASNANHTRSLDLMNTIVTQNTLLVQKLTIS